MAAAIAGPSVISGDNDTARPAFRPRASVSETTKVSNGPGESPPLSPKTAAAITNSIIGRFYAGIQTRARARFRLRARTRAPRLFGSHLPNHPRIDGTD